LRTPNFTTPCKSDLPNPFNGGSGAFGTLNDFSKQLTQDYFYSVNQFWLDTFHVDGFRFDDVPEYWDGPTGSGYANLVYSTYQYVKSKAGATDHYQRFFDGAGNINLIQIAEYLPNPPHILNTAAIAQAPGRMARSELPRVVRRAMLAPSHS
jgi:maltooligosyltrehalose trehalohydrolase